MTSAGAGGFGWWHGISAGGLVVRAFIAEIGGGAACRGRDGTGSAVAGGRVSPVAIVAAQQPEAGSPLRLITLPAIRFPGAAIRIPLKAFSVEALFRT